MKNKKTNIGWIRDKLKFVTSSTELKKMYQDYVAETKSKANVKTYERDCERVWKEYVEGKVSTNSDESTDKKFQEKFNETVEGPDRSIVSESYDIRTLDQLLAFCRVDSKEWEVKKHSLNAYGSKKCPFFQVKAWLSQKTDKDLTIEEQAEKFRKFVKGYKPDYTKINSIKRNTGDKMFEISLPDFHFGQLSWKKEVGTNYNINIAEKLWMDAISYYIGVAKSYKIHKFLLPIGNDFFNVDNTVKTTTAGTLQDEDGRWQKTFSRGWQLVVKGIDMLLRIADVDVVIVPGNHDTERTYYLGEVLKSWYKDCKKIKIDNRPITRKYYRYGNSLIGMSHGKEEKLVNLSTTLAVEAKEDFAKTCFWEFQIGHLHQDKRMTVDVTDHQSVKIRVMPSIVPASSYAKKHAYMSTREGVGLLWDKEGGKVAEFSYYPKEIED